MKLSEHDGRYFIDGREVTREEYDAALPSKINQLVGKEAVPREELNLAVNWKQPIYSDSLGVHPVDVGEAEAESVRVGVPTNFAKDGRPIFTSSTQFRRYAKAHGLVNKSLDY